MEQTCSAPVSTLKILTVDNNPVILKLLLSFLEGEGHEVVSATDGLEAINALRGFRPDVLITDLIMPRIDGDKLCRILRHHPDYHDLFIVIYSAVVLENEQHLGDYGADACIAKGPFAETRQHLTRVLDLFQQGNTASLASRILGDQNLVKRRATTELLAVNRAHEQIFNTMADGVVNFTADYRIFRVNPSAIALFNKTEAALLAGSLLDLFCEADQLRIKNTCAALDQTPRVLDENMPFRVNGRALTLEFLRVAGTVGNVSFVLIIRDITEKRRATRELELLRQQQQQILNSAAEGICGFDPAGRITFINPTASAMIGHLAVECLGRSLHSIVHQEHAATPVQEPSACPISQALQSGRVIRGTDLFWRKNGTSFPVKFTCAAIKEAGETAGAVYTFSDITQQRAREEELLAASMTDELTGLFNRRGFMIMLDKLMRVAAREHRGLLLLYLDLDNLKKINDTLGHAVGDEALAETARLLRETFRDADVIGRLGGDEFVVLLSGDVATGRQALQRLNEQLAAAHHQNAWPYRISLSTGSARYDHAAPCRADELLSNADTDMYQMKQQRKALHQGGYGD